MGQISRPGAFCQEMAGGGGGGGSGGMVKMRSLGIR